MNFRQHPTPAGSRHNGTPVAWRTAKPIAVVGVAMLAVLVAERPIAAQVTWTKDLKVIGSVSIAPNGDLIFIGSDAKLHRTDAGGAEKWNFALGDIGRAGDIESFAPPRDDPQDRSFESQPA